MDDKNINLLLDKLPTIKGENFFLKYQPIISQEYAKTLVNKTIYFTWKHMIKNSVSNEMEIIKEDTSCKVLNYKGDVLQIYTNYVLILEKDLNNPNDLQNNDFIQEIPLKDISNVAEFTTYNFEGWEILPDDYFGKIYKITNVDGITITAIPYDFDGNYLYLAYKQDDKISKNKYPISLISNIELIS